MAVSRLATILLILFLSSFSIGSASPLPPNVRASRSANGRFLVFTDREYDGPEGAVRRTIRTTYRVFELEPFLNQKDRLQTQVPFWSESAFYWQVVMEGSEASRIFWPLISNDGRSLALIAVTWPWPKTPVLKIYRQKQHGEELIRSYDITDLWTPSEVDPVGNHMFMARDSSPQWFSGGAFSFSDDSRTLTYLTQWNDKLSLDLRNGSIERTR